MTASDKDGRPSATLEQGSVERYFRPLKRRLFAMVLAFLVLIVLVATAGIYAVRHSEYLLQRAGKSHLQLQALTELHGAVQRHFNRQLESLTRGAPTPQLESSAARVEAHFEELRQLAADEVELLRDADERLTENEELQRLEEMHQELNVLLELALTTYRAAPAAARDKALLDFAGTLLEAFEARVVPLLDLALADERLEVAQTEQALELLRSRLQWASLLGVKVSLLAALLFVWAVGRALLQPVGVMARTSDELAASNARLQAVDANRRRFLEDIGHELRSPVTIITGEAEVTLRETRTGTDACRQALERIRANAGYLSRRIEELIRLARAENGELQLRHEPVDLDELLRAVLDDLASYARIHQVTIETTPTQQALRVLGDSIWLRQMLLTLLDNAIRFSPALGVVRVRLQGQDGRARVSIADQGPGIAADELPYLFERYYQAEAGRRSGGGHGLGMAIARWIVERHGGEIGAVSELGQGTQIDVQLPLSEPVS